MKMKTMIMAAAAGAALAYFMDSERGPQRRAQAKSRAEQLKAQAVPKINELRRYTSSDMLPADEERMPAFAIDGASTPILP